MSSPSDRLARRIVEQLLANHLISHEDAARLTDSIATGQVMAEDWRLSIEKMLPSTAVMRHADDA